MGKKEFQAIFFWINHAGETLVKQGFHKWSIEWIFSCVLFSEFIHKDIDLCIAAGNFVDDLKQAEVRPFYKKDGWADKSNYWPISILSNV